MLDDYSGAFEPDFDLTHLSRRALAVLGREWLLHGHLMDRVGMPLVHAGHSREEMEELAIDEWMTASPIYSRRMQRALNFGGGDVPTILKNIQLDVGAPHQFMDFRCKVDDPMHGEFWLAHCGALMDVEPMGDEYVHGMCHHIEDPTFDATAVATNPRAQIRPIHRPPRVPSDRNPHCHWTVVIDPDAEPVQAHHNVAVAERSLLANIAVADPGGDAEPGGWSDYAGPFDPDFQLEDLSHRALVVTLQEFALQSHLMFRAYLLSITERFGCELAHEVGPRVFVGLSGMTAQRVRAAMAIGSDDAAAIAKLLQLHPMFFPRTYVDIDVQVVDQRHVRFALRDAPVFGEADDYTWFGQLDRGGDRAFAAMARAVNARAQCARTDTRPGERFAYEVSIDPAASPALDEPEVSLVKISTGATFQFTQRRPVRV